MSAGFQRAGLQQLALVVCAQLGQFFAGLDDGAHTVDQHGGGYQGNQFAHVVFLGLKGFGDPAGNMRPAGVFRAAARPSASGLCGYFGLVNKNAAVS